MRTSDWCRKSLLQWTKGSHLSVVEAGIASCSRWDKQRWLGSSAETTGCRLTSGGARWLDSEPG